MSPRRLLAVVCAAVAGAAACGGDALPAASVNDTDITQEQVVDELDAIRGNRGYVEAIEGSGSRVLGEDEGAFDNAFVATQLGIRIQYAIVSDEVRRRDLDVDAECRTAARSGLVQQLARLVQAADGEVVLDAFPEPYQEYLIDREADVLALQGDLVGQPCVADAAAEAYYDEHPEEFEQVCSSHILVATREEADEIVALLAGGADFATLARERSTDTGSAPQGGELPCVTVGQLVPEFEEAIFSRPVGVIGEPVQTSFGFHVIRVGSRGVAPFDDVRDDVNAAISSEVQTAFARWFGDALAAADVTVDPRYGEWDPSQAQVIRSSAGAPTTPTSAPAADR